MKEKIWIIGPCSMENEELYLSVARELYPLMKEKNWYYKGSFDKANRSSLQGERGPGLEKSLEMFKKIKEEFPDIKLTTDVHETHQVKKLAPYIDVIQIPAFLCRQTDLLVEAAKHFDIINIKKGQWMSPENMKHSVGKIKEINPDAQVWLCERGTQHGYQKLIVDFGIVEELKESFDRFIIDATHSTQYTNKEGFMKGNKDLAKKYLLSSMIFEYDGVFAETHPKPEDAVSDGTSMIHLDEMPNLIGFYDKLEKAYYEHRPESI